MSEEHLGTFILTLFNELANDDQDSVRLLTIEILVAIAKRFDVQKNRDTLLEPLKSLARDKAWRVRYMVASKFVEVRKATKAIFWWYPIFLTFHYFYLPCRFATPLGKIPWKQSWCQLLLTFWKIAKAKSELQLLERFPVRKSWAKVAFGIFLLTKSFSFLEYQVLQSLRTSRPFWKAFCLAFVSW